MRPQAQLIPPVLEYEPPQAGSRYRRLFMGFRIAAFVCLLGWGYYNALVLRGYGPGSCLPELCIIPAIYAAPFAVIAFLGMRWRYYCAVVAVLIIIPALVADVQCTIEEELFVASVRTLPPTAPIVFKNQRWWPNETSYLYYQPWNGQLGGGD